MDRKSARTHRPYLPSSRLMPAGQGVGNSHWATQKMHRRAAICNMTSADWVALIVSCNWEGTGLGFAAGGV